MWLAVFVGSVAVALVLLKLLKKDKYKHFKGLTVRQIMLNKGLIPHEYLAKIKEPLVKFETPVFTAIMAQDADSAKFILSDQEAFPKTDLVDIANSMIHVFKNAILMVNGDQWRRYRNVLSPPFHFDAVKQWVPDFHDITVELMNHWKPIANKPIDITYWMPLFTFDVLGVTVLSRRFNSMNGGDSDLTALKTLVDLGGLPSTYILGVLERWTGLNLNRKLNKACQVIERAIIDIVNSKRLQKSEEGKFDLVDVMVQAHDPKWTENELLCNAVIMFSAGYETTSTALTWLVYHLTQNLHVQDKLVEEVNRVLQGQPIRHEHMKDLTYLSKVIKENMRLQPPVTTLFTRSVAHDIEYNGLVIPKDSRCGLNIFAIHRSPEYWDNPEEFNPDRFDKPTVPFSYLPFSLKQRACLGNQFSLVEQTVFVATFLQHFRVQSLDFVGPQLANNPIVNQLSALKVNLTPV